MALHHLAAVRQRDRRQLGIRNQRGHPRRTPGLIEQAHHAGGGVGGGPRGRWRARGHPREPGLLGVDVHRDVAEHHRAARAVAHDLDAVDT